jgi:hypothetical protein
MAIIRRIDVREQEIARDAKVPRGSGKPSLTVQVAKNRSELLTAYKLVYRQYVEKGYIAPHAGGIVYSPRFGEPTSRTAIASNENGHIVGTWTMVGDTREYGLPLEGTFPLEVERLRKKGRRLAEVTCLCMDPKTDISSRDALFALTKYAVHHSYLRRYDDVLLAVHPRHQPFYWRTLRAAQISPCRPYEAVSGSPAVCCCISTAGLEQRLSPRMRRWYFAGVHELGHYDGPPISMDDHEEFCRMASISPDILMSVQSGITRWAG